MEVYVWPMRQCNETHTKLSDSLMKTYTITKVCEQGAYSWYTTKAVNNFFKNEVFQQKLMYM